MTAGSSAPVLAPMGRFEWERMVMRVQLGQMTKFVALGLATFADRHGANAHPGRDRLAAELEINERTVRRALERLRDLGLVVRTDSGSSYGRRRVADVYQLTQPPDLSALLLPSPATAGGGRITGLPSPVIPPDQWTPESSDPEPNSGLSRPDHWTLGTDQWTPTTGTVDSGVHPPTKTTDSDHTRDQAALRWAAQPTTAREGCGQYGHEFGGWPCRNCAADAKAAG